MFEKRFFAAHKAARKEKYQAKDPVTDALFCGNMPQTAEDINYLHKRLTYAISTLSGMQQNGGMGTEFDTDSDKEDQKSLVSFIKDMMTAFSVTVEELK